MIEEAVSTEDEQQTTISVPVHWNGQVWLGGALDAKSGVC